MASPTKAIQFNVDNWEAIEKMTKSVIDSDKGWYFLTKHKDVRFLYGFWIINRDGVWSASKDKPRGV